MFNKTHLANGMIIASALLAAAFVSTGCQNRETKHSAATQVPTTVQTVQKMHVNYREYAYPADVRKRLDQLVVVASAQKR
ncbi:MAG: hypothetical protein JWM39_640 [Parcubacteria group bacterium]|nr:hypothetical protein [Parcubacteria group bacterium]